MSEPSPEVTIRHHYFLIGGVLLYTIQNGDTVLPDSNPANAIVRHDDQNFPVHKLAKAQQNLHKSFVMKLPEEARASINVHDIIITNVSYLGYMSEDEFQFQPAVPAQPSAVAAEPVPERI